MALWLLAICSLCSFWLQPVLSGCGGSKIGVLDDVPHLRLPSESEQRNKPLPHGKIGANVRKLLAADLEEQALGPEDGLKAITVFMPQVRLKYPPDDGRFVLRVNDAPMLITIESLRRRIVADRVEYDRVITRAEFFDENISGSPGFERAPVSPNEYDKSSLFKPNEVPQFDMNDALKLMKQNWHHRIYFKPAMELAASASLKFTRQPNSHIMSALGNGIVVDFEIAGHIVLIAPDDGPDFAHIYALPRRELKCYMLPWIMRPPQWLKRAKASQLSQN